METQKIGNVTLSINPNAKQEALDVIAGKAQGGVIGTASNQLMQRSPDESYASLADLKEVCKTSRELSRQAQVNLAELSVSPVNTLSMNLPNGKLAKLTHYSLSQLVQRIGYNSLDLINRLPANLAADVINHGLKNVALGSIADTELAPWESDAIGGRPANVNARLLWRENGVITLDSVTSATHGRFFDIELAEFAESCQEQNNLHSLPVDGLIKSGIKGSFFKSDRDCFIALVDNTRRIFESDKNGGLSRMLLLSNSEVSAVGQPLVISGGYYGYVCANWNFWNATKAFDVRMRHTKHLRDNFVPGDLLKAIREFFETSPVQEEEFIAHTKTVMLGDKSEDCVNTLLGLRLPILGKKAATQIMEDAVLLEDKYQSKYNSVWTIANAITERAQDTRYTSQRVAWQEVGREVFDLATN